MKFPTPKNLIRSHRSLSKIADAKLAEVGGWKKDLPTKRGLWFQAVWQSSGYFHVQRFPGCKLKYLRAQNDRLWSGADPHWAGPFPETEGREEWTRHLTPPSREKA